MSTRKVAPALARTGAAALLASACLGACDEPRVLPDGLVLRPMEEFENTVAVIPPGINSACPDGTVVLNLGLPDKHPKQSGKVGGGYSARPLLNGAGVIAPSIAGVEGTWPIDSLIHRVSTDNQILRLGEGRLLAFKHGTTWEPLDTAFRWQGAYKTGDDLFFPGSRAGIFVFESADCGYTWGLKSLADPARLAGGNYAWPQRRNSKPPVMQLKDATGDLLWYKGGFDRSEAYRDPWTDRLFISTGGDTGPFPDTLANGNVVLKGTGGGVVLSSTNNGASWQVYREFPNDGSRPLMMTTTRDGTLWLFRREGGGKLKLYYGAQNSSTPLNDALDIVVLGPGSTPIKAANEGLAHVRPGFPHPALARLPLADGLGGVRVAFMALNSWGRQVYHVVNVTRPKDGVPVATLLTTISAEDERRSSVTYAAFVQPQLLTEGAEDPASDMMLFWIESTIPHLVPDLSSMSDLTFGTPVVLPSVDLTPPETRARFVMFQAENGIYGKGDLSVSGGLPRSWGQSSIGHYTTGSAFVWNDSLRFLGQWSEEGEIAGNIVSIPR